MADGTIVFSNVHFVVVDDHAFVRRFVMEVLKGLGAVAIDSAADGAEAVAVLTRLGAVQDTTKRPLCVLTDFEMPNMNGLALLRAVRMGEAGVPPITPVLMLTGSGNDEASEPAKILDVNGFVAKPVSRDKLSAAIVQALAGAAPSKDREIYAAVETG